MRPIGIGLNRKEVVYISLHPTMTDDEVRYIGESLAELCL